MEKFEECKDCIYFQEKEEELTKRYNSGYDIAFELTYFVNNCNICKGDN